MEEKVLIQSEQSNAKKLFVKLAIIGVIISAILLVAVFSSVEEFRQLLDSYDDACGVYSMHQEDGFCYSYNSEVCERCEWIQRDPTKFHFMLGLVMKYRLLEIILSLLPFVVLGLIGASMYFWLRSQELTVTDKRIYGKAAFGKRVDLPMGSVSAVGTSFLKGVDVGTSSGKIQFKLVENQAEVHSVISKLLLERQKTETSKSVVENVSSSNADELKKYKDLLDSGVITQEEFDAKKKQLLGL